MRYDLLSGTGTQLVQTPFLDRLAARGIKFTHSAVTTSICWISRATLMTGQYLARHRSDRIRNPKFYDSWNTTWPYILQSQKDYYVGHIGKWHFNQQERIVHKFDFSRIFEFKHWLNIKGKRTHVTDHTENMAIEFLKTRPKDKPLLLFTHQKVLAILIWSFGIPNPSPCHSTRMIPLLHPSMSMARTLDCRHSLVNRILAVKHTTI